MTHFSDLGLHEMLLKAVTDEGYTTPTPIQAQAIGPIMEGRDLLGIAQTGTGKTAAFALPILHRLEASRKPAMRRGARCLVLAPTRELATQIAESFKTYGRHLGFSVITVFGGVGHRPQANALQRGVDVVVATPGRLIDHMNEGNIDLSATEVLVLDEADQMMDLGFIRPLRQIISKLSQRRQSLFFSATMPHEIGALAAEMLRDPHRVSVTPVAKTADRVAQQVIYIEQKKKKSLLVELFGDASMTRTLIFTRTKRGADRVARHLDVAGIKVAAIHGNKSQGQREQALAAFKGNKLRALVATDIAARGIDVDEVSHVVNFEIPNIPESYVHRIGRTARAGAEGIAISLVDNEERAYLRDIEKLTRQQIPFSDRRNDTTLAVEERSASRSDDGGERGGQRQGRGPSGDRGAPRHRSAGAPGRSAGGFGGDRTTAPRGERRDGAARGNGPRGDSQRGDSSRGDGPRGDVLWSNHGAPDRAPRNEQPARGHSDRPRGDRQHGADRANGDRPFSGRSNGDRSSQGRPHDGGSRDGAPRQRGDGPARAAGGQDRGPRPHAGGPGHRSGGDRPHGERPARAPGGERRADHARSDHNRADRPHGGDSRPQRGEPRERTHAAGAGQRTAHGHRDGGGNRNGGEHRGGESRPSGRPAGQRNGGGRHAAGGERGAVRGDRRPSNHGERRG